MRVHDIIDNRSERLVDHIKRTMASTERQLVYEAAINLVERPLKQASSV